MVHFQKILLSLTLLLVSITFNSTSKAFAQSEGEIEWLPKFLLDFAGGTQDGKCGQITANGTFYVEQFCDPAGPVFDPECFAGFYPNVIYDCNGDGIVDEDYANMDCIIHSTIDGTLLFDWLDEECKKKSEFLTYDNETWIRTKGDGEVDINNLPEDWNHSILFDLKNVSGIHGSVKDCPRCPKNDKLQINPFATSIKKEQH